MREEIKLPSTDGKNKLHVYVWYGDKEIKGIIQISHGMTEHMLRYNHFAEFLVEHGYAVVGNDHLGHGHTAACDDDLGYFGEGMSATVIDDLHEVTKYAKNRFSDSLPYILFGHSMGSFMARRYLMTYGQELNAAVICGTGYTDPKLLNFGLTLLSIIGKVKSDRHRSKLFIALSFGDYNKRIPNVRTANDWLTKDEKIVDRSLVDKFCRFKFTVNGYKTMLGAIKYIQNIKNVRRIPENLPILMISGTEDPVGDYGDGVRKVYDLFMEAGMKDVELKFYEGDRHELVNETDRDKVMKDVVSWINKKAEVKS